MAKGRTVRIAALDGGTTNTRARLIEDGRVVATARRAVGVRDNVLAGGSPLIKAVRECLEEVFASTSGPVDRVVAAGMLSSEVGLAAVPHVIAPAGLDELAAASVEMELPDVHERPILIVPGVRTLPGAGLDGWAEADLMRGEEVETFGAIAASGLSGNRVAFLWPGSHTKLVVVDRDGRITGSFTTLAGEITATLAGGTLIAKSLPATLPDEPDDEAVVAGARAARRDGIGRAAFLVRIADVTEAMDEFRRASFWIGAVLADDADAIDRRLSVHPDMPIVVGGREPQRSLYARFLGERRGADVRTLDDATASEASARGVWEIALRRS